VVRPGFIAHADWGTDAKKRQVAVAVRSGAGYEVVSLAPAMEIVTSGTDLRTALRVPGSAPGPGLAGFDFPIGLPTAYAEKARIDSFPPFLGMIGRGVWSSFDRVAEAPEDVSLYRPFYPARPGGTRRAHLQDGLGLSSQQLRRRCDGTDAETVFWTLGGKQVGKAALAGWAYLGRTGGGERYVWPFDGTLDELLGRGTDQTVVAETYPAEFYRYFRFGPEGRGSKRRHGDRVRWMPELARWQDRLGVTCSPDVSVRLASGFAEDSTGEDEFDAFVGLLGMIAVVVGQLPTGEPRRDLTVTSVEGWMLGRQSSSGRTAQPRGPATPRAGAGRETVPAPATAAGLGKEVTALVSAARRRGLGEAELLSLGQQQYRDRQDAPVDHSAPR